MQHAAQDLPSAAPSRRDTRLTPAGKDAELTTLEDTYVHPGAAVLFEKLPWVRTVPIFGMCCEGYGPKCTVALSLCYFVNKGLGKNLLSISRYAMFVDRFGINGTRYQRLSSIASMATSIKAFAAVVSDTIAFFGYTKRWICAASCLLGGAFALIFGLLPSTPSCTDIAAGLLFLSNFCIANVDILSEGHYSRLMRRHPRSGPALISWIWWFILIASIVAACVQGPLSDMNRPQIGIFISAAAQGICIVFFLLNWYGERPNYEERLEDARTNALELVVRKCARGTANTFSADDGNHKVAVEAQPDDGFEGESALLPRDTAQECELTVGGGALYDELEEDVDPEVVSLCWSAVEINKGVARKNWRIIVYSAIMTCAVVAMTCTTILGDSWELLGVSVAVCVVSTAVSFLFLPTVIAQANTYLYLHMCLYLQITGATDSFYMAKKECYPEGPHFSYVFYNTIGSVIGNLAGIVGVTAFSYIFAKHSYRFTLIATVIVQIVASIFDIIIVKRWNLAIGIPDHAMYLLGDAVVYEVCYYLAWMPMVMLLSRVCPRGSESMVYAIVAGSGNLGQSMGATVGSILLEKVWPIVTVGAGACDFHNLPILLTVSHLLLPLLIIPLSIVLIPSARICDDIDINGDVKEKTKTLSSDGSVTGATEPIK